MYVAMRAATTELLPDLREARGHVATAAADISDLFSDAIGAGLGVLSGGLRAVPGGLLAPVAAGLDVVSAGVSATFGRLYQGATALGSGISTAVGGALAIAGNAGIVLGSAVAGGLSSTANLLTESFKGIISAIPGVLKASAYAGVGALSALLYGSATVAAGVAGSIGTAFKFAWEGIKDGARAAGGIISGAFSAVTGIMSGLVGVISGVASGIAGAFTGIFSGVVGLIGGIANVISGLAAGLAGILSAALGGVKDLVEGILTVLGNVASSAISLLARTIGSVLNPALGALSADLTDWGRWIEGAMQGETVMARLTVLLRAQGGAAGWTAEQLDQMARKMAEAGTNGLGQIRQAELVLARFGNVRGLQFAGALEGARQLSALLGTDMVSAAQTLGRALENPEHGMQALRRAGVILSDNERHMVQWAAKSGDVVGAQNVILGKLAQMGNVAGAVADTTEGHVNRLRLTWESVGGAIGKAMLPVATIIVDFLQPIVQGFAESMKAFFGGVAESGQGLLANARTWIAANQDTLIGWGRMIGDTLSTIITIIRDGFVGAAVYVTTAFGVSGESIQATMAALPGIITRVLSVIKAALSNLPLMWDLLKAGADIAFNQIKNRFVALVAYMKVAAVNGFDEMLETFDEHFGQQKRTFMRPWDWLMPSDSRSIQLRESMNSWENLGEKQKAQGERARKEAAALKTLGEGMGAQDRGLHDALNAQMDKLRRLMTESDKAAQEARKPPPRLQEQREKDRARDMRPTPAPIEDVQVRFSFLGIEEMWKSLQRSITGTSPEALARMQVNATNGVRGAVEQGNEKLDGMLNWFRNQGGKGGGFGP